MSLPRIASLPVPLLALLSLNPLVQASCYVAAYGLVGEQDGWTACPGTASSSGGVETCCMPGSECGEDSLCHVSASDDPGNNAWYQAGCTDPNYADSVCRNNCVDYTQTYVQYDDSTQLWMCCGNGGCNGTVTGDTFEAVAPDDWKAITGASATTSSAAVSSAVVSSATASPSSETTQRNSPSSADFKPTPIAGKGDGASLSNPTSSSTSTNNGGSGLSSGAQAGIGVAIAVATLALIAALVAIFILRRNRRQPETVHEKTTPRELTPPPYSSPSEVSGEGRYAELPTSPPAHELPGDYSMSHGKKRY